MEFIQGYQTIDFNEIFKSDHRGYIIDIDLESYFNIGNEKIQKIKSSKLDLQWKLYRIAFLEQIKDIIYIIELDKIILNLNVQSIKEELDRIDEILTHTMNIVQKNIEGLNRIVSFSMKKINQPYKNTLLEIGKIVSLRQSN